MSLLLLPLPSPLRYQMIQLVVFAAVILISPDAAVSAKLHESEIRCHVCAAAADVLWKDGNAVEHACRSALSGQGQHATAAHTNTLQSSNMLALTLPQQLISVGEPGVHADQGEIACSREKRGIADETMAMLMDSLCERFGDIFMLQRPGGYFRGSEYEPRSLKLRLASHTDRASRLALGKGLNKRKDAKVLKKACRKFVFHKQFQDAMVTSLLQVNRSQSRGKADAASEFVHARRNARQSACRHSCVYAFEERMLRDEL